MSKKSLLLVPLLLGGVALAKSPWVALPFADKVLKEADHQALGEQLLEWLDSLSPQNNKKIDSLGAKENLRATLDKWSKKRGVDGRNALSLTEDLGASIWYSFGYDKQKGIKKGKVAEVEVTLGATGDERALSYAFWAPAKYRPQDGPYPLILCIPSEGEAPTNHLTEKWVDANIRDNAILACVPMPADLAEWTTFTGLGHFFAVFKDVTNKYAVDFDRVYIAGRGVGVATAMEIASRFPDRFAGVVGRTGDASVLGPENFCNLPTFFAGAGKAATDFQTACKAAGHDNVTLEPAGQEPEVWAWIQGHPRQANPTRVMLRPGTPFPNRAYWLQVLPTDVESLITGEIDRAANKITIEAKGVTQVTVCFNDLMVDLDKPVKIACNGVEREELIPRSLDTFLDRVKETSNDPGKLYTAFRVYDVPVVAAEAAGGDGGGQ